MMMMKTFLGFLFSSLHIHCVLLATEVYSQVSESTSSLPFPASATKVVVIHPHKVFRYKFHPNMFLWKEGDFGGISRFSYTYEASLKGLPDMPDWLKYRYSNRHKAGFIYGVPPEFDYVYVLDVVSTNRDTFETGLLQLHINVTVPKINDNITKTSAAIYNVKLKIDNLNIEDVFDQHRLENLKNLFRKQFWPRSQNDLHMTSIASSLELGYRRPLRPTERDGVVLKLGSNENFSTDLIELDRETTPLRVRPSCPRNFKRTSVERYFREKGFAIDWCAFRLMIFDENNSNYRELTTPNSNSNLTEDTTTITNKPPAENYYSQRLQSLSQIPIPISRNDVPRRKISSEFLLSAFPALVVFVLAALVLFGLLWFNRKNEPEEEWEAFTESLFLVVKDCFTCCHSNEDKEAQTKLVDSNSSLIVMNDPARNRRASSVQRQTESLRRLAQSRDITPMLQTPINQQEPYVPGQPPPPSWMSGSSSSLAASMRGGMIDQFGSLSRASIQRGAFEELQRPAPPPYSSISRLNPTEEDEGTYLV